jgi:hypothetical protein
MRDTADPGTLDLQTGTGQAVGYRPSIAVLPAQLAMPMPSF